MRAEVTPEQAISLAETLFDCAASSAHPLAGYDDANFLLEGKAWGGASAGFLSFGMMGQLLHKTIMLPAVRKQLLWSVPPPPAPAPHHPSKPPWLSTAAGPSGRFVLKVINSADSAAEGFSEAQSALMLFLADRGVAVPRALPLVAAAGGAAPSYTAYIAGQQPGVKHAVRLLTYLPGTLLKDADQVGGQSV